MKYTPYNILNLDFFFSYSFFFTFISFFSFFLYRWGFEPDCVKHSAAHASMVASKANWRIMGQLSGAGIPDCAAHDKGSSAVVGDKSTDTRQWKQHKSYQMAVDFVDPP